MTNNTDLKLKALELAGNNFDQAKEIYAWLTDAGVGATEKTAQTLTTAASQDIVRIKKAYTALPLSKTQKAVMGVVISMHRNSETINGTTLAAKLKCSGANALVHLKTLRGKGYVVRDGQKHKPIRTPSGAMIETTEILPAGKAIGYKGQV